MQWTSIPEGYKHWAGDPAEDNIGPFFFKSMAPKSETALCLQEKHCNMFGIVHGGVLMAFVDYTLCLAGLESTEEGCVTVTCDISLLAPQTLASYSPAMVNSFTALANWLLSGPH
mgnify:CR=1 FL=1